MHFQAHYGDDGLVMGVKLIDPQPKTRISWEMLEHVGEFPFIHNDGNGQITFYCMNGWWTYRIIEERNDDEWATYEVELVKEIPMRGVRFE